MCDRVALVKFLSQLKYFSLRAGYDSTLLVYGGAGSGKNYTLFGKDQDSNEQDEDSAGMVSRLFEHLFTNIRADAGTGKQYLVAITFVQLCHENFQDLLVPFGSRTKRPLVGEDEIVGTHLIDVTQEVVDSQAALELAYKKGRQCLQAHRENKGAEAILKESLILEVAVESNQPVDGQNSYCKGRVRFVKIAGGGIGDDAQQRSRSVGALHNVLASIEEGNGDFSQVGG